MIKFKGDKVVFKIIYKDMKINIEEMKNILYVNIEKKGGGFTSSEDLSCDNITLDGFDINKAKLKDLVLKLAEIEQGEICKMLDGPTTKKEYEKYKDLYYQCDKIIQPYLYI